MDCRINSMVPTMVYEALHDLALGYLFNFISYQSSPPFPCSNHTGLFTVLRTHQICLWHQDFSLTVPSVWSALKSDICMTQIWPFQRSLPWLPYQNQHFYFWILTLYHILDFFKLSVFSTSIYATCRKRLSLLCSLLYSSGLEQYLAPNKH